MQPLCLVRKPFCIQLHFCDMDFDNIHCDVGDLSNASVSADETHVDAAAAALPAVLSGLQLHEDLQEDMNTFILQYVRHETNMFLFQGAPEASVYII